MLKATQALASLDRYSFLRPPLLDTICKYGAEEDAEQVYQLFLLQKHEDLLQVVMTLGNDRMAEDLFTQAISNGVLREDFPPETLVALSYLGQPNTLPILIDYYNRVFELGWALQEAVCLALLNYSCEGYEVVIEKQVERCLQQPLFPDYVVLPAARIHRQDLIIRLNEHAAGDASPSCCGPILLATALNGPQNKQLFLENIMQESWAVNPFEDNSYFINMGLHALGIPIKELYAQACLSLEKSRPNAAHLLHLITGLLEAKLKEPLNYFIRSLQKQSESFLSLYQTIFAADQQGYTIFSRLESKGLDERLIAPFTRLEELYRLKAEQEAEAEYRIL
ncbi:hypothetical protein OCK74_03505 [Chitinophagaceae bacterium LB-8]|uniref:Uncharacterized protein n=1 Tax=Paraflavisolibacter caeni TaxID=2982496 RepID=A0A9X2XTM9_9BACT|nr:hypothetical protein [Paraflavisolibacter caeni]MCU7548161.1 hypothetical protein [Paraflavisolibacter caeni]